MDRLKDVPYRVFLSVFHLLGSGFKCSDFSKRQQLWNVPPEYFLECRISLINAVYPDRYEFIQEQREEIERRHDAQI
ncbi:hypothetical protein FACS189449_12950 [Alphaproteobacteria bacterium]|nr:hypothetical protein FACS189449_12950 [Alphaproteobacteria bacterium]